MLQAISGYASQSNVTSISDLLETYGRLKGVRSNMVVGDLGIFRDQNGSSRGLSTPSDLELLVGLRRLSDLIAVDAATARIERYRSLPNRVLAIFSKIGNFESIPAIEDPTSAVLLISPSLPNFQRSQMVTEISGSIDAPFEPLLEWANSNALSSVLLETGPSLTKLAIDDGIVTQAALTITSAMDQANQQPVHPLWQGSTLLSHARDDSADFTLWG